jgi:hypothetical protein
MLVLCLQGRLERARTAKPLKPRRDLGVIDVRVVAAAGADELEQGGVAAFGAAVHDAGRLAPHECHAAVAGLPGQRKVIPTMGPMRSHGSRRSCRHGAGTATRRTLGPAPVSGLLRLLTQLTARPEIPALPGSGAAYLFVPTDHTRRHCPAGCPAELDSAW